MRSGGLPRARPKAFLHSFVLIFRLLVVNTVVCKLLALCSRPRRLKPVPALSQPNETVA